YGVVAAGNRLGQATRFHAIRRDLPDRPVSDVVMVRAPIGHRAAGVFIPEAERAVAALFHVADGRSLAQPVIPIETLGRGRRLEGAIAQAGGQPHLGLLQFTEAAVAHEFASETETLHGALLRAGLQHHAV